MFETNATSRTQGSNSLDDEHQPRDQPQEQKSMAEAPARWSRLKKLGMEPPFRLCVRSFLKRLPVSVSTRAFWDISDRPHYLLGVLFAARQALEVNVREISVIEFGVAGGNGLLILQKEAEAVEKELGVSIKVYGFDNGAEGLPELIGDYRDHPDMWRPGDFPMDESLLRSKLSPRTTLILGDVKTTVSTFYNDLRVPPVGFISVDLDLYSSTTHALRILSNPEKRALDHVPIYFDDVAEAPNHRFAGELLAIDEFNEANTHVKIDQWRGIKVGRPFPEAWFCERMFMAHDLQAISGKAIDRHPEKLSIYGR
jgi:hypothetical protein